MTQSVANSVRKSSSVWMSYSIMKLHNCMGYSRIASIAACMVQATQHLQNSRMARKSAVSSCARSDSPVRPGAQHLRPAQTEPERAPHTHTHTASVLLGDELVEEHANAQEVDSLGHDEQRVMVLDHQPQQEEQLRIQ